MPRHPGRSGHAWRQACKQVFTPNPLICWLCGQPIDKGIKYPHPMSKSVDHVIPISRMRGMSPAEQRALALDPANLRPAHLRHNISRGNRMAAMRPSVMPSRNWYG